jgi:hypothetical protein
MTQRPLAPNRNNDGTQDSSTTPQRPGGPASTEVGRNALEAGINRRQEARNTFGKTEQLRYPEKLGASDQEEQPHWLKILVRVREQNSQAVGGQTTGGTYEETAARRLDQESAAATAARVGAATGVSSPTGGLLGLIPLGNLLVKATKAVTGAAAGAIAAKISGSNKSKTLTTSIALGLQEPPKADYSVTYEEQALGSVLSGGKQGMFNTVKGMAGESLRRNINPGKMGEVAGFDQAAATAAVDKSLGKVRNPYREQIFKQVDFRDFTFEYTFLPESVREANTVLQIIRILRQNMLPEVSQNSFYMIYPAEFSLFYMYKDNFNRHVHQFSDCVLTGMTLKYGGQDFVTFKGTPGIPAEINMTLKFREIVPLTGDRVLGENL